MKVWWPWRKSKKDRQAYPQNAPGAFYVGSNECMCCGVPHTVAPELMTWETDEEGELVHCYFRKQPETADELIQAIEAVKSGCCDALRYKGSDPEIIRELRESGCGNCIG